MPDDIASAARRVAVDAHRGFVRDIVDVTTDLRMLLPVLDAVAAGKGEHRAELLARAICDENGGYWESWITDAIVAVTALHSRVSADDTESEFAVAAGQEDEGRAERMVSAIRTEHRVQRLLRDGVETWRVDIPNPDWTEGWDRDGFGTVAGPFATEQEAENALWAIRARAAIALADAERAAFTTSAAPPTPAQPDAQP